MKRNTSAAKAIVCTVVLWTIPLLLAAQRSVPKLEDLPRRAIDTLDTDDSNIKIVIFTNNTWCYYYPDLNERMDREVYREHWVNDRVFAYTDIQLERLPPVIDLQLIDRYGDFHAPAIGKVFSKYGTRGRRRHQGVDIPLSVGEPIYAAFNGKVRYARYNTGGYGNLVIIRHENGLETWYAHLTRCNVAQDDYVTAGTVIGFCGNTGRSRGAHLHFEMRYCDQAFDPEHLIDFSTGDLRYQTFALDRSFFSIYSRASETLKRRTITMNPCSPYTLRTGNSPQDISGKHRIHHTGRHQTGAGKNRPSVPYHPARRLSRQNSQTVRYDRQEALPAEQHFGRCHHPGRTQTTRAIKYGTGIHKKGSAVTDLPRSLYFIPE